MGHELTPRHGGALAAQEVVKRLGAEFQYVRVDEEEGLARARAMAAWLRRMSAKPFLGREQEALRQAIMLENLHRGEALVIEFGDTAETARKLTLLPENPIQFSYQGEEDERAASQLVRRCARALDCDVERF